LSPFINKLTDKKQKTALFTEIFNRLFQNRLPSRQSTESMFAAVAQLANRSALSLDHNKSAATLCRPLSDELLQRPEEFSVWGG
jgi:hypothetical protein